MKVSLVFIFSAKKHKSRVAPAWPRLCCVLTRSTAFSFTPSPPVTPPSLLFFFLTLIVILSHRLLQRSRDVGAGWGGGEGVNCTRQFRFTVRQTLVGWGLVVVVVGGGTCCLHGDKGQWHIVRVQVSMHMLSRSFQTCSTNCHQKAIYLLIGVHREFFSVFCVWNILHLQRTHSPRIYVVLFI